MSPGSPRAAAGVEALALALEEAKRRLISCSERLDGIGRRTRAWDVRDEFLARRGLELRREAQEAFDAELAHLRALVSHGAGALRSAPRQQPLVEIRRLLRYLRHSFDGGSPLLGGLVVELDRALDPAQPR